MDEAKGALDGITILDLTRLMPGEFCTSILADLGADVIKVEEPKVGDHVRLLPPFVDGASIFHKTRNRNKRSITLNLKEVAAKEIFYRLAKEADVMIESFRPRVVERLGVDYQTIREINPAIAYCSITAFGQDGPYADRPAHDINILGMCGLLDILRDQNGNPATPPIFLSDLAAGAFAAIGIQAALIARQRTGKGQFIDIAMLDCALSLMINQLTMFFAGEDPRKDPVTAGKDPSYNIYRVKHGKYVTLGAMEDRFWQALCDRSGITAKVKREKSPHKGVKRDRKAFIMLKKFFARKDRDEVVKLLNDVCCTPVYSIDEVISDSQVRHRRLVRRHGASEKLLVAPLTFSETPCKIARKAPGLGEQSYTILRELGYAIEDIDLFRRKGII